MMVEEHKFWTVKVDELPEEGPEREAFAKDVAKEVTARFPGIFIEYLVICERFTGRRFSYVDEGELEELDVEDEGLVFTIRLS